MGKQEDTLIYMKIFKIIILAIITICIASCTKEEVSEYEISIKDHFFKPDIIEIPTGKRIKLIVKNLDETVEEFESLDLNREKIIPAKASIHLYIGPLKPGKYNFFGEFNLKTAQGHIIVKGE